MPAAMVLLLALASPPDPRPARIDALFAHLNASPSPGAAVHRAGNYRGLPMHTSSGAWASLNDSEELGTSYRVASKDGALELQHRHRGPIAPFTRPSPSRSKRTEAKLAFVVNGDPRSRDVRFVRR